AREQVLSPQQQLHGQDLPCAPDVGTCPHSTVNHLLVNDADGPERCARGGLRPRPQLPPLAPASICFWIFSRLNEPGVWLGGYSLMDFRTSAAMPCSGTITKTRSRNQSL